MNKLMHPDPYEQIATLQSMIKRLLTDYVSLPNSRWRTDPFIWRCIVCSSSPPPLPSNEGEEGDAPPPSP